MYEVNRTQVTDEPVQFEKISQHVGLGNTRNWIDCAQNSPRSWVPKQTPKQLEVAALVVIVQEQKRTQVMPFGSHPSPWL